MKSPAARGAHDAQASLDNVMQQLGDMPHIARDKVALAAMLMIVTEKLTDNADFSRGGKQYEAEYWRTYGRAIREWTRELGYM